MKTGELSEPQCKWYRTLYHGPFLSSRKWETFLRCQREGAHIFPNVQETHCFSFKSRTLGHLFLSAETVLSHYCRILLIFVYVCM